MSNDALVIKELERSGFPFERKIRKKLSELGIETFQSRYFLQNQYGEVSKDIDVLGNIKFKTFETKDKELFPNLQLRLVGEVKKWDKSKICFYELDNEKPENFPISFPNFLNNCYHLGVFAGGYETLFEFYRKFGNVLHSKTVCYLEEKLDNKKNKIGYKNNGNEPIYNTSNDLALACEYFHKREIIDFIDSKSFKIHGCFPVIFTDAEILKISGIDKLSLKKVDYFIYLVACRDLGKVPITTKEKYYLPILIASFDGIDSSTSLIKKISDTFYKEVENLVMAQPNRIKAEYDDYKKLVEKFKK